MKKYGGSLNLQKSNRKKVNRQTKTELEEFVKQLLINGQSTSVVYNHVVARLNSM